MDMTKTFTNIYDKNRWGGGSGSGSKFSADNKWYITQLRNIIDKNKIKTIADLGCGDWEIMKHFTFKDNEKYTGIDCVESVIDANNTKYNNSQISFKQKDISLDIPKGFDLIIIKDVIQHWDDETITPFLDKLLKHNKYVYSVNGYKFMRDKNKNNWVKRVRDKKYSYHPISYDIAPFTQYNKYITDNEVRRAKQYVLLRQPKKFIIKPKKKICNHDYIEGEIILL